MDKDCTVYRTADFIGRRWTLLILLELCKGKPSRRYSELKKSLPGITPKILSTRLKELEKEGLVKKRVDTRTFPVRCDYSLTKSGGDFIGIIKNIKKWALRWKFTNKTCSRLDCKECMVG
ncbi:transcriptional regulator [Candidatus Woesearchaeota archaeon CG10_big_fil_rev_8_21_14_0_10_44_13]|nr:MAG: transcriptional regulator [Candidatus Woesearchaeota archaeon CG10_big_fil_rev_8_21_14_0_10_44_13]